MKTTKNKLLTERPTCVVCGGFAIIDKRCADHQYGKPSTCCGLPAFWKHTHA